MSRASPFQKILVSFLVFLIVIYFLYGFYVNENAAGGGGYNGDLSSVFKNLQLFVNNNFIESIKLTSNNYLYYTNRPPLLYILHSWLNPYSENLELFRLIVFFISILTPFFFYFSLKIKFKKVNNFFLIFIASLLMLSPYFRTSSYWGLEENYAIISLLFSFISLNFFFSKKNYRYLFFAIFFSSLCIYFDQKFIIIPAICICLLIFSKIHIKYKIFTILLYFLFSLPFIYLIQLWGNITPVGNMEMYKVGNRFHFHHICFITNILGFYLFPFFFFLNKNRLKKLLVDILKKKTNHLFLCIALFYLIIFFFFLDISPSFSFGGGYSYKAGVFFSENIYFQKLLISVIFIFSFLIILIFANDNLINASFIIFFLLLSILINPLLHEYLDPLILIFFLTFSKTKMIFNIRNVLLFFFYFLVILQTAKIYH